MRFTIYDSPRSQKGELCTFEKWCEVTESEKVHRICVAISKESDSEKRSKLKRQLPVITWQAEFEGQRKAELAKPSGLFMLDIDHVERPFQLWNDKIVARRDELGIMFAGMTASQHGLRLVAKCRPEFRTLAECQKWLADQIGVEYDSVCKDFARCSFVVTGEYTYFFDARIFTDEPAEGTVYKPEDADSVHIPSQPRPAQTSDDENHNNVVDQREGLFGGDDEFRGIKISDIAKQWLEDTGGIPEKGERNTRLFALAMKLRYITDFNEAILLKVMPNCGLPVEEMKELIHHAVGASRGSQIPKEIIDAVDKLEKRDALIGDIETDDEIITDTMKVPPLPPVFKQYYDIAPSDFKSAVIMCQLPILGTLGSKLRAKYLDGRLHSPSFIVSLEAPQASGKSFMSRLVNEELKRVIDHDEAERSKERDYDERVKTLRLLNQKITPENKDEVLGSKPETLIRYVPATMSITKLLMRLNSARGLHLFAFSPEIDTVTKSFKKAVNSYSDVLRIGFDNDVYGQDYASENSFSGNVNVYYNFLTSGTPKAMRRFYPDIEDGLVSRVCFVTLPDQFAKRMPVWAEMDSKSKAAVEFGLERLNEITIQGDEVQPDHVMKMSWLNKELEKWILQQQAEALRTSDRTRDIFCRRSAVVGFRAGMLAWFLYGEKNTPTIRRNVMRFSIWIANNMLNQHLLRFNIEEVGSNTNKWEKAYKVLNENFTREELGAALRRNGYDTAVKTVVYKWRISGLIEETGQDRDENGRKVFTKFRKLSR